VTAVDATQTNPTRAESEVRRERRRFRRDPEAHLDALESELNQSRLQTYE
jgi:hypothetical protein